MRLPRALADRDSPLRRSVRRVRRSKGAVCGLVLTGAMVVLTVVSGWITPHDPTEQDISRKNLPPPWIAADRLDDAEDRLAAARAAGDAAEIERAAERVERRRSDLETVRSEHLLLGTDDLGRDVLSRVLAGGRLSLWIGLVAMGVAALVGIPLGSIAGYAGGRTDAIIMRLVDVVMAFPTLLLAIAIVAAAGRSLPNLMIAVGVVGVPRFARQIRAGVLQAKEEEYVTAARGLGAHPARVLFLGILPNVLGPVIVLATLGVATAILEVAALAFIGLGPEAGTLEWGTDIAYARERFFTAPWTLFGPGAAIAVTVLGFNLLGDGLRDAWDPRSHLA